VAVNNPSLYYKGQHIFGCARGGGGALETGSYNNHQLKQMVVVCQARFRAWSLEKVTLYIYIFPFF
jgi:hypothetical protein